MLKGRHSNLLRPFRALPEPHFKPRVPAALRPAPWAILLRAFSAETVSLRLTNMFDGPQSINNPQRAKLRHSTFRIRHSTFTMM